MTDAVQRPPCQVIGRYGGGEQRISSVHQRERDPFLTCCTGIKADIFIRSGSSEGLQILRGRQLLWSWSVAAWWLNLPRSVPLYEACDVLAMGLQAFLKLSLCLSGKRV